MASVAIVGDSQSVNPGKVVEEVLRAAGHKVSRLSNTGNGPYDYVRLPNLWRGYTETVRVSRAEVVLLIFGSNDAPNDHLRDALDKMKRSVRPKVLLSGPPLYPDPDHQVTGQKIQDTYREVFREDFIDAYPHTPLSIPRDKLGFHFTLKGSKTWGEAMAAEVLKRLSSPKLG